MIKAKQISESIELGALLAISGGMMDAYSYIERGEVFANAQTGNMLLFGVNLSVGNFHKAIYYFCPILAFTIGILLPRRYFGVCSKTIFGRLASFSFIFFLSIMSMLMVCATASICCCCSACFFCAFFPKK